MLRSTSLDVEQLKFGGADRDRTGDPLLAKQVLSQLSYSPLVIRKYFRGGWMRSVAPGALTVKRY